MPPQPESEFLVSGEGDVDVVSLAGVGVPLGTHRPSGLEATAVSAV